jgi:DNA modification methylase
MKIPLSCTVRLGDARDLGWVADESVHLVVTSPPYWVLKKYNEHPDQLGDVSDYETFQDQLEKVWRHCFRVLVKGGRLVCVIGDVCIARRRNAGRHLVMPLHADIAVRCRRVGFDYLTPILWHKNEGRETSLAACCLWQKKPMNKSPTKSLKSMYGSSGRLRR